MQPKLDPNHHKKYPWPFDIKALNKPVDDHTAETRGGGRPRNNPTEKGKTWRATNAKS